jgi:hypothetical protein
MIKSNIKKNSNNLILFFALTKLTLSLTHLGNAMNKNLIVILLFSVFLLGGCASGGTMLSSNVTQVDLSQGNYTIVATNLSGEGFASYLVGFSYLGGERASIIGFLPTSSNKMNREATEMLWEEFAKKHGEPSGRKLALTNIRYDYRIVNFLLFYSEVTVYMTADVIEFED